MSVILDEVELPLAEFSLVISEEFAARTTAICGSSGAGKTSLLEIIAGLRSPQTGSLRIGDRDVTRLPPRHRRIGYVPQDDALFPHMSVRANIFYGTGAGRAGAAAGTVALLEIESLLDRSPDKLSGGERKRVALARALLSDPDILLLDEPLAGVHTALRGRVLQYLARVRDEFAIPMIYVTHDMQEAAALCDEIVMLDRGRVIRRDILTR